jgi:hypothetical protein
MCGCKLIAKQWKLYLLARGLPRMRSLQKSLHLLSRGIPRLSYNVESK